MSCIDALPNAYVSGWSDVADFGTRCLAIQADAGGRYIRIFPDTGVATRLDLTRGRFAVAVGDGPVRVALRTSAVRSAGDGGYLGVNGEAFVPEVDAALAGVAFRTSAVHLRGELGIVPDLWVTGGERAWGLGGFLAPMGEALGWMERADLGVQGSLLTAGGHGSVDLSMTTGEGYAYRERNEGKDLAFQVAVAPLASTDEPHALVISVFGRDGSRGIAYARNSRLGARVAGSLTAEGRRSLSYGLEGLAAWGVDGDETRTPMGMSAWVTAAPIRRGLAVARFDGWSEDLSVEGAGGSTVLAGAGVSLGPSSGQVGSLAGGGRAALLVGVAHTTLGAAIAPVSGGAGFDSGTSLFVQVDAVLRTALE